MTVRSGLKHHTLLNTSTPSLTKSGKVEDKMNQTKATQFRELDMSGLSQDQQTILRDYMSPVEGSPYYGDVAQLMIDFMKNPEGFRPSDHAMRSAYVDFVVRRFDDGYMPDGREVRFPTQIRTEEIDKNRLKDVRVNVEYGYSSTLGRYAAIVALYADAQKDEKSEWEKVRSGGVAFSLDKWVERLSV